MGNAVNSARAGRRQFHPIWPGLVWGPQRRPCRKNGARGPALSHRRANWVWGRRVNLGAGICGAHSPPSGAAQFFATPRSLPAVPEGHMKVAQHFSAGSALGEAPSPDRDGRPSLPRTRSSLRDWPGESPRTQHSSAGLFSVVPPGRPKPRRVAARNGEAPPFGPPSFSLSRVRPPPYLPATHRL